MKPIIIISLWIGFTTTPVQNFQLFFSSNPATSSPMRFFKHLFHPWYQSRFFALPSWNPSQRVVLQSHLRYSLTPKYLIVCNWHILPKFLNVKETFFIFFIKVVSWHKKCSFTIFYPWLRSEWGWKIFGK